MSITRSRLVVGLVGLLVTAVTGLGAFIIAGAAEPTSGSVVPDAAQPVSPFTAGIPFSSGQNINVVVPTNGLFSSTTNLAIEECSAPSGVVPILPSACDGNTIQGPSLKSNSDGSVNFQTETKTLYTVYALPDVPNLGESPSGQPQCGDTSATECILFIGYDQNDFTKPHVWSQPFFIAANATDSGTPAGDGSASTATPQPTSLTTSLSGDGQSATSISVPTGTAVTDTATLSGTNAATATGTVTYNVYSDTGCSTLAPGGGGTAETITTPGSLPASSPVTLSATGTYYWGVSYSGDSGNQSSSSTCGTAGEVETVTTATVSPKPTRLRTQLSGGRKVSGRTFGWESHVVVVVSGAPVIDSATLRGTNAATATGTVTYTVYSKQTVGKDHHRFWHWVVDTSAKAGTVTVTAGQVPNSNPVTLPHGIYEWQAVYSGDAANRASSSRFGSETEFVIPPLRCGTRSDHDCQKDVTR